MSGTGGEFVLSILYGQWHKWRFISGDQAWISDDDGDQTVADPTIVSFQASLTQDFVRGWNFDSGASFGVYVWDFEGGTRLWAGVVTADAGGNFHVDTTINLVPGYYVLVGAKDLVLADVTFEPFDVDNDVIGGTASPNALVGFGVGDGFGGVNGQTVADGSGTWSVNLDTEYGFDLLDTHCGEAWVTDDDADQTQAEPPPEI